jgi:DNA-binding transcriptional regulator YiaG
MVQEDIRLRDLARVRELAASGRARLIREQARLSLSDISNVVGVDKTSIFRWETGKRRPTGQAAVRWLRLLEELLRA